MYFVSTEFCRWNVAPFHVEANTIKSCIVAISLYIGQGSLKHNGMLRSETAYRSTGTELGKR
jgi:hypothetical protein